MKWLLLEDDWPLAQMLTKALTRRGEDVVHCETVEQALALAREQQFQRAVFDLKLANETSMPAIAPFLAQQRDCKLVVLTGYASIASAVQAVKEGAHDYLCKPVSTAQLLAAFDAQVEILVYESEQPLSVDRLEWEHIQRVMQENDHNVSATARALGMHRRTLQRKLAKKPAKR